MSPHSACIASCIHKDYMRYVSPQRENLILPFLNNYYFWSDGILSNCFFHTEIKFSNEVLKEIPFKTSLRTENIHMLQSTQRLHSLQRKQ
jgi:hypothetical protein